MLAESREQLRAEAGLLSFLAGSAIQMMSHVRVHAAGVEGLSKEVTVADVLRALEDELLDLQFDAIRGVRS